MNNTKDKDYCFECGKPLFKNKPISYSLYSMGMIKPDTSIIAFDYCEDCFQEMAGKKYVMMMENYINHMSLTVTGAKINGVHYIPPLEPIIYPMPSTLPKKKFRFKNIFVHDNGVPTTFCGVLAVLLFLGIYFLAMYKIIES